MSSVTRHAANIAICIVSDFRQENSGIASITVKNLYKNEKSPPLHGKSSLPHTIIPYSMLEQIMSKLIP